MNWKNYAIFGAIVLVAVVVALKFTKLEGKAADGTTTLSLTPSFSLKKETV